MDQADSPLYRIMKYAHYITGSTISAIDRKPDALDSPAAKEILDKILPEGLSGYLINYYKDRIAKQDG